MYKCGGQCLGTQRSSADSSYCPYFMTPSEMCGYSREGGVCYDIFFCVFSYRCSIVGFLKNCCLAFPTLAGGFSKICFSASFVFFCVVGIPVFGLVQGCVFTLIIPLLCGPLYSALQVVQRHLHRAPKLPLYY